MKPPETVVSTQKNTLGPSQAAFRLCRRRAATTPQRATSPQSRSGTAETAAAVSPRQGHTRGGWWPSASPPGASLPGVSCPAGKDLDVTTPSTEQPRRVRVAFAPTGRSSTRSKETTPAHSCRREQTRSTPRPRRSRGAAPQLLNLVCSDAREAHAPSAAPPSHRRPATTPPLPPPRARGTDKRAASWPVLKAHSSSRSSRE